MNVINLFNYKIYLTDSCYKYLNNNIKKKYKIFVKNKGTEISKTIICFSKYNNYFNKLIYLKNIFLIIDMISLCFLKNTCIHYNKKLIINSPCSNKKMFLENKILNKIIFLIKYIINKKLLLHNGYIKLLYFNFNERIINILFNGNCKTCNLSKITFNNFVIKIIKKNKFIKKIIIK